MDATTQQTDIDDTRSVARRAVGDVLDLSSIEAGDSILHRLNAASSLRDAVDKVVTDLVIGARSEGCTWAQIGEVLGVSTQAAHQKYRHLAAEALHS